MVEWEKSIKSRINSCETTALFFTTIECLTDETEWNELNWVEVESYRIVIRTLHDDQLGMQSALNIWEKLNKFWQWNGCAKLMTVQCARFYTAMADPEKGIKKRTIDASQVFYQPHLYQMDGNLKCLLNIMELRSPSSQVTYWFNLVFYPWIFDTVLNVRYWNYSIWCSLKIYELWQGFIRKVLLNFPAQLSFHPEHEPFILRRLNQVN